MGAKAYICIKRPVSEQFLKSYFQLVYIKKCWVLHFFFSDNEESPELWLEQEFT